MKKNKQKKQQKRVTIGYGVMLCDETLVYFILAFM